MMFKRNQRLREKGALDIPLTCLAESFKFELVDGIYDIQFNAEMFKEFPKVKYLSDGIQVNCYRIPHRNMRQVEYFPHKMVW